uniref:Secreted phosphoprotein 24 n=1 Tax=Sphaeramia orbicularis TaxID=375764 RepID=A0A672YV98_9TELE
MSVKLNFIYSFVCVLIISFLFICAPLYNSELEAVANRGLQAALSEVNSMYAASHLYGVTRGSISRVIPVGMNMVDLLMTFGIKETQCLKTSRNDPQTCAFRPGFFVPSFSCFSRVRMTSTSAQVVSLRCGHDGSSSSESSEEVRKEETSGYKQNDKQLEKWEIFTNNLSNFFFFSHI